MKEAKPCPSGLLIINTKSKVLNSTILLITLSFLAVKLSIASSSISFADSKFNTCPLSNNDSSKVTAPFKLTYRQVIIPTLLVGYGVAALHLEPLKNINTTTREEILKNKPKTTFWDDYTQYAPGALVFGLNALGVKGKSNLRDRVTIYAMSQLISGAIVVPLKHTFNEERPDGSNNLSFPSGHTATAFSNAQFMYREYRDANLYLSLAGYPFAIFTATYRVINNKHWVGDVVAGAGFGILSTELAYWLQPKLMRVFSKEKTNKYTLITPYYSKNNLGLSFIKTF